METTEYTAPVESADAAEARMDWFDYFMPQWEEMTNPERFVSEDDMLFSIVTEVTTVTIGDWDFFIMTTYVDPAEREV